MPEPDLVTRIRTKGGPLQDLLVQLDLHRVLTVAQLARATGTTGRTVRSRLERLRGARLVDGTPDWTPDGGTSHWWLSAAGARLIEGTRVGYRWIAPSGVSAVHAAATAEVWLALREYGPAAGIELTGWRSGPAGRQGWEPTDRSPGRLWLTPDAVARLSLTGPDHNGAGTVAFIEVDLASTNGDALQKRVRRYLAYARDQAWAETYPHCPALLLLTTTEARAARLARAAGRLLDADPDTKDSLLVAACAAVHEPHRAVREACWTVPGPTDADVTLAELLGHRLAAAAIARDRVADPDRADQAWWLWRAAVSPRAQEQLADEAATEALRYLAADPGGLLDMDPELAEQVLAWWAPHDGRGLRDAPHRLRQLLHERHRQLWIEHARSLLVAAGSATGDDPLLAGIARQLAEGRLLSASQVAQLDRPAGSVRTRVQRAVLGDYEAGRDRAVDAQIQALGWRARRRADRAQLADAYDAARLLVCDTCALVYPRHDDAGAERYIAGDGCAHCAVGRLTGYGRATAVPTLARRLDLIRGQLP
ncbi:hypothetical protein GCM10023322_35660 [Rugosimonospora acidiphila]|uniref:Uncharacterized protein n=1 Tax=Rugosimonospora acidiphila TaxID=556531 RepID=A0ABP9RVN3_9ACTN